MESYWRSIEHLKTQQNGLMTTMERKKLMESYYQERQEDDQHRGIVQQVLRKSTDFLRRHGHDATVVKSINTQKQVETKDWDTPCSLCELQRKYRPMGGDKSGSRQQEYLIWEGQDTDDSSPGGSHGRCAETCGCKPTSQETLCQCAARLESHTAMDASRTPRRECEGRSGRSMMHWRQANMKTKVSTSH